MELNSDTKSRICLMFCYINSSKYDVNIINIQLKINNKLNVYRNIDASHAESSPSADPVTERNNLWLGVIAALLAALIGSAWQLTSR